MRKSSKALAIAIVLGLVFVFGFGAVADTGDANYVELASGSIVGFAQAHHDPTCVAPPPPEPDDCHPV